jgi:hypothetical protein
VGRKLSQIWHCSLRCDGLNDEEIALRKQTSWTANAASIAASVVGDEAAAAGSVEVEAKRRGAWTIPRATGPEIPFTPVRMLAGTRA